jgi:hypothetical protein
VFGCVSQNFLFVFGYVSQNVLALHFVWCHQNFGLHDLVDPRSTEGPEAVNLTQYGKNIAALYRIFSKRAKHVIFATTTPCPAACGGKGRSNTAVELYNKQALKSLTAAAAAEGKTLLIDDLYTAVAMACNATAKKTYVRCPLQIKNNVHFTPAGSEFLAQHVAKSILAALASSSSPVRRKTDDTSRGVDATFNIYHFGAVGDGKANDTAAIQRAIDASVAGGGGGGVVWAPPNGTYMLGAGLKFIGHAYDGVRLQLDAPMTLIDDSLWPHCPQNCTKSSRMPVCPDGCGPLIEVHNVDGFELISRGAGGLFGTKYCLRVISMATGIMI